jgi:archaellin
MNRRRLLGLASTVGISAIAGCSNLFGPDPESITGGSGDGSGGAGSGAVSIPEVEGIDTDSDRKIDTLRVHVVLARGASGVDLSKAIYLFERSKRTITGELEQQNAYLENGGGSGVTYEKVAGGNGNSTVLQQREDKIVVTFDLTAIDGLEPLEPEAEMTFELETAQGVEVSEQLTTPETINPDEAYLIQ